MLVVRGHRLRINNIFLRMRFTVFHDLSSFGTISHYVPYTIDSSYSSLIDTTALLLPLYSCHFLGWNVLILPKLSYQTAADP